MDLVNAGCQTLIMGGNQGVENVLNMAEDAVSGLLKEIQVRNVDARLHDPSGSCV